MEVHMSAPEATSTPRPHGASTSRPEGASVRTNGDELILMSRVKGTPVHNSYGDKIGHIEDLSIARQSGKIRYALMSFGGFLGIGEKFHPLPWSVLRFDEERQGYTLPLTKEELTDAPSYTADELAAYGGEDVAYSENVYRYYARFGTAPYM
jgi:hypothetical protein